MSNLIENLTKAAKRNKQSTRELTPEEMTRIAAEGHQRNYEKERQVRRRRKDVGELLLMYFNKIDDPVRRMIGTLHGIDANLRDFDAGNERDRAVSLTRQLERVMTELNGFIDTLAPDSSVPF